MYVILNRNGSPIMQSNQFVVTLAKTDICTYYFTVQWRHELPRPFFIAIFWQRNACVLHAGHLAEVRKKKSVYINVGSVR